MPVLKMSVIALAVLQIISLSACSLNLNLRGGGGQANIAVLPFENLAGQPGLSTEVTADAIKALTRRGMNVAREKDLMPILLKHRVRSFAYLSRQTAGEIGTALNADAVLTGSVLHFSAAGDEGPQIGMAARLIDAASGRVLWADYGSASGKEFASIFGFGDITEPGKLIHRAVDRLFGSFSIRTTPKSGRAIAVMPFQDRTRSQIASAMITDMFLVRLFKSGFDIVEPGNLRDILISNRIWAREGLDYDKIEKIGRALGVDGILLGSIEEFSGEDNSLPRVEITIRLIDTHSKRILWMDSLHLIGEKAILALTWEQYKTLDATAYEAVSKLVKDLVRHGWEARKN